MFLLSEVSVLRNLLVSCQSCKALSGFPLQAQNLTLCMRVCLCHHSIHQLKNKEFDLNIVQYNASHTECIICKSVTFLRLPCFQRPCLFLQHPCFSSCLRFLPSRSPRTRECVHQQPRLSLRMTSDSVMGKNVYLRGFMHSQIQYAVS